MRKLALALLKGKRAQDSEPEDVDEAAAADAAVALYEAGQAKWGTSEDVFISLLAAASPTQAASTPCHAPPTPHDALHFPHHTTASLPLPSRPLLTPLP